MASNRVSCDSALRILLVDADLVSLMNLRKMLNQINMNHQVWTCSSAGEAVIILGEQNENYKFDIVMSDVNMSDMDACNFFDHVANKLDIPLIMMSMDGETSKVKKGIQHGACAYLLKPITYKDVLYLWQHVYRKTLLQNKHQIAVDHENSPVITENIPMAGKNKREREIVEISNRGEGVDDFSSSAKKPRLIWTTELNIKFMNAVAQIKRDKEKIGPKRILELMNEPSLTRENISSHLQKYRIKIGKDTGSQVCDTNNICSQQSRMATEFLTLVGDPVHTNTSMDFGLLDGFGYPVINPEYIGNTSMGTNDEQYENAHQVQNAIDGTMGSSSSNNENVKLNAHQVQNSNQPDMEIELLDDIWGCSDNFLWS